VVLLDNMPLEMLREAVALAKGRAITEASGGINPKTAAGIAATGVNFLSMGWLTHSAPSLDVALDVGGFRDTTNDWLGDGDTINGQRAGEDWGFTLRCRALLGREGMRHHPEVTWTWMHHGANTSGRPDRW
jgi:hypothetical protein